MSTQVFPSTAQCPGIDISISRQVDWGDVIIQEAVTGQEVRVARRIYPRRMFELKFNFLRSSTLASFRPSVLELQTFEGFFNNRQGMFDSFLWTDPDDNATTTSQLFGSGDGVTQNFQLQRSLGGFSEPVFAPILTSSTTTIIYKTDWQGKQVQYTVPRTNYVVFSDIPSAAFFGASSVASTNNLAPDGSLTGMSLIENSSNNQHLMGIVAHNTSTNTSYTFSMFMKAGTRQYAALTAQGQSAYVYFDLVNGTLAPSSIFPGNPPSSQFGQIQQAPGGWFRCSITFIPTDANNTDQYGLIASSTSGSAFYVGNGTGTILMWGPMVENSTQYSPTPTSYIPTSTGGTITVTDYSINGWGSTAPGLVEFGTAPAVGAFLSADIAYNYPVRFADDKMTFERFVNLIYENKKVGFESLI